MATTATKTGKPAPKTITSTGPKVDAAKELAKVLARQRQKENTEVLTGTVVATGPDAATGEPEPGWPVRALAMTWRIVVGSITAPAVASRAFKDWRLATEFDSKVAALEMAGDHAKAVVTLTAQLAESEKRRKRAGAIAREAGILAAPVAGGGWFWVTIAIFAAMCGSLALLKAKAMHGKVVARLAEAFAASLLLEVIQAAMGVRPVPIHLNTSQVITLAAFPTATVAVLVLLFDKVTIKGLLWSAATAEAVAMAICLSGLRIAWSPSYLLPPVLALVPALIYAVVWAVNATKDDGTVRDNLGAAMVPADVPADATPDIARAVIATGALPKDATPILVMPGALPGNGGKIWTAAVDTGGPSAEVFLSGRPRRELAAQLKLSTSRTVFTVDKARGSRLHITAIVGEPWGDMPSHPLLSMPQVDLWQPIPFGLDIQGNVITYGANGFHSLFGGETGAGKSVAFATPWCAYALSPAAEIYMIDGGEADTRALDISGVATAWTQDRDVAIEILRTVLAEMNRRLKLLGANSDSMDDIKATPEWMAEHGLGHILVGVDELPTFTQDKSDEAKMFTGLLREILQKIRKTGGHVAVSAQSPGVTVLDSDSRSIIANRWAGRARDAELCAKILGSGTIGRGVDPRSMPHDIDGLGWWSTVKRDVLMRPYNLGGRDRAAICRRGAELRKAASAAPAAMDEGRMMLARAISIIRESGVDVGGQRVMRSRDVATRMEMDQMQLRTILSGQGVGTQIVRRTDSPADDNRSHYVLSDFPAARTLMHNTR